MRLTLRSATRTIAVSGRRAAVRLGEEKMLRALALSRGLAALLAVTVVLGLSSCGGDGKGKRPAGEIVFWHVLTGDYEKHLLSLIDEFNASGNRYVCV